MCIKCGPCQDLLERLQLLEDTVVGPFEGIPEDEISLDVPELTIDLQSLPKLLGAQHISEIKRHDTDTTSAHTKQAV